MPLTLPAHAAAILPLLRVKRPWVVPSALVLGTCAPDLSYLLRQRGTDAHSVPGLFSFCVPAGLLALVWLEVLVLPVLRRTLPGVGGVEWGRFLHTRGLPRTLRGWGAVVLCLLVGAATHLLWDGFTHLRMWPAQVLYPDIFIPVGRRALPLARALQHLSSLGGSLVVLAWMVNRYPLLPPTPAGSWRAFLPVLGPTVVGAVFALAGRLSGWRSMGAFEAQLWWIFWPTVAGAVVGLTVGCLVARLSSLRQAS